MAQYTLLDVVNAYMDATDGYRVADIDDVIESQQVAKIAEKVFHEVVDDTFYNDLSKNIIQLESLADSTRPNYLKLPDNVSKLHESAVRYNVTGGTAGESTLNWKQIPYLHPNDFLDYISARSTNETNSQIVTDFSGMQYVVRNSQSPSYCTSFDQKHLVFDAFDSDVDSVLQQSKNIVEVTQQRSFTVNNSYVIDLPQWFHPTYLNMVISRASEYLRGEPLPTDARKGRLGLMKAREKQRIGSTKYQKKRYGR